MKSTSCTQFLALAAPDKGARIGVEENQIWCIAINTCVGRTVSRSMCVGEGGARVVPDDAGNGGQCALTSASKRAVYALRSTPSAEKRKWR